MGATTTFKTLHSKKKIKRMADKKMPKVIENPKNMLVVSGRKSSQTIKDVLKDIYIMKRPHATNMIKQTHDFVPFENVGDLENFCKKYDTSHFALGSHTKKRPNNLILGRVFNYQMLDMVEFGVTNYEAMTSKSEVANSVGSKPCILFQGDLFENDDRLKIVQNLFLDMFRGEHDVKRVNLLGLDHAVVVTALSADTLHFGHYSVRFEKSGQKTPKVVLNPIGPNMTLVIRRHQFAAPELRAESLKLPPVLTNKNAAMKNVFINELGERRARVFVGQQDISSIALKKSRALSKSEQESVDAKLRQEKLAEKLLANKRKFNAEQTSESSTDEPPKKKQKK